MIKALLPATARPLIEARLPDDLDVSWFSSRAEAVESAGEAEIAWLDMNDKKAMRAAVDAAEKLQWLFTIYAGLDHFPTEGLAERGVKLTNGVGINTIAVAEYAVLGMLALAKRYDEVVRLADRQEWPRDPPGNRELYGSKALILGYGAIGEAIGDRLKAFGVDVTGVARTPRPDRGVIGQDEWRAKLGEYDWLVVALPATGETEQLIGQAEFAAMKTGALLCNIARGEIIDQDAMIAALKGGRLGGAYLDVTDPEPLPDDHPLWDAPNTLFSMHLSGRSTQKMFSRAGVLFLENLERYRAGRDMKNVVDLDLGY
ncbi:D-2-hydroxyacid dehydrogenase [Novosphingopyxis sp.]|uniref:D-2-hydroxyacid dehydrogenase n=1 Tax=Novosphingopyxis sp. TaxID=2709690 RepID=UPI003B599C36